MKIRFTCGGSCNAHANPNLVTVDLCLEASFGDKVVQAAYTRANGLRCLVYRNGHSGKWLRSEGISMGDLLRTPENLVRAVGLREPDAETYVMPAI